MKSGNIGFIGAGHMASKMVQGLITKSPLMPEQIWVCGKGKDRASQLEASYGIIHARSLEELVHECGILFLAFKPQQLKAVTDELVPLLKEHQVVSVLAGIASTRLHQCFGHALSISRIMLNTSCAEGLSFVAHSKAMPESLISLIKAWGPTYAVEENSFDVVTGMVGSGPGYIYQFAWALEQAVIEQGVDEVLASEMVRHTLYGAAHMLEKGEYSALSLRDQICSQGGTTEAALNLYRERGFDSIIDSGLKAAINRASELNQSYEQTT